MRIDNKEREPGKRHEEVCKAGSSEAKISVLLIILSPLVIEDDGLQEAAVGEESQASVSERHLCVRICIKYLEMRTGEAEDSEEVVSAAGRHFEGCQMGEAAHKAQYLCF